MDQRTYDAAQQGVLLCLLDPEHEKRLMLFMNGLKNDGKWTDAQLACIQQRIRELLLGEPTDDGKLSSREAEALRLIAQGHTNKEMAERFELNAKTVETYKTRALTKLGLKTRADIVQYARKRGWL